MAYSSTGLYAMGAMGRRTIWCLETVEAVGDADAPGYITDAITAASGKGAPGKGMQLGDLVFVIVVGSGEVGIAPNSQTISDTGMYYVSALNTSTGAGTITALGAS